MTTKEAIERIKIHKEIHKLAEPRSHYINIALDMAIAALEFQTGYQENEANAARYGEWIKNRRDYTVCSNCGKEPLLREDPYSDYYDMVLSRFCPHCGAKMTGMR